MVDTRAGGDRGASSTPAEFYVMVTGQIETAAVVGYDNLYCDFSFTQGPDWTKMDGLDAGITQVSKTDVRSGGKAVWNMPLEIIFRTTNVFGWPRLVMSVYALDSLGRNLAVGYGTALVPPSPGRYRRTVRLFTPVSSTPLQSFFAWLTANRPEYWDPRFVAQGKGREVTRVKSTGSVTLTLNVSTRGMSAHGFTTGAEVDGVPSDALPPTGREGGGGGREGGGGGGGGGSTWGGGALPRADTGMASVFRGLYRQGSGYAGASSTMSMGSTTTPVRSGVDRTSGLTGFAPTSPDAKSQPARTGIAFQDSTKRTATGDMTPATAAPAAPAIAPSPPSPDPYGSDED